MEKTKCAVIQDDILAVKHALANGIAFEALEGDDLKDLLSTLQAQRAEVIKATKREVSAASSGAGGASFKPASPKASSKRSAPKPSQGARNARTEAPAAKEKPAAASAAPKRKSPTPTKRPAPPARPQAVQQQEQAVAKKPRTTSTAERLRQLRKSIRVHDVVSVLMDIPVTGAWIRSWVRGEVTREMNRSGIFQIAFDHDKHGQGTVKLEPGEGGGEEEERWIHEQRLEIDHPDFFCGQGSDPPRGPDDSRPRGSWYLHRAIAYSNGDGN